MPSLYSWGANTHGQLSLGHCEDVYQPSLTTCSWTSSLEKNTAIIEMEGGANHMMILDDDGNLYACGDNRNGQLFIPSHSETKLMEFKRVMSEVASVACGWDFSVVARKDGSVIHSNYQGRVFNSDFEGKKVCKVSCGVHHSFALTEDHVLFGLGSNKHGELGSNVKDSTEHWAKMSENVKEVAAGLNHSLLWMEDGTLRFLGKNKFNQDPSAKVASGRVIHVGSGWNHTIVITEQYGSSQTFHAHCYGKNDMGQLGSMDTNLHYHCFALPFKPIDLRVGSEHALILFENGRIMIWGWNEHGTCACSPSLTVNPRILNNIEGHAVTFIGCTFAGCFAVVE